MAEKDATPRKTMARDGGRRDSGARRAAPAKADADAHQELAEKALNAKIDGDVADRAMNAFYGVHQHARWRDFVQDALDEYTTRLEQEHNRGNPFPPRPAENLPRGRKVGISPRRAG